MVAGEITTQAKIDAQTGFDPPVDVVLACRKYLEYTLGPDDPLVDEIIYKLCEKGELTNFLSALS